MIRIKLNIEVVGLILILDDVFDTNRVYSYLCYRWTDRLGQGIIQSLRKPG